MKAVPALPILVAMALANASLAATLPPWQKVTVRVFPAHLTPEVRLQAACDTANLLVDELKPTKLKPQPDADLRALRDLVCRKSS
jgi:hypothetical protein